MPIVAAISGSILSKILLSFRNPLSYFYFFVKSKVETRVKSGGADRRGPKRLYTIQATMFAVIGGSGTIPRLQQE